MNKILDDLIIRYPALNCVKVNIMQSFEILKTTYNNGGKLLIAGNGGSAADSEHICGELMKSFVKKRKVPDELFEKMRDVDSELASEIYLKLEGALPAIALTGHTALTTAIINDTDGQITYAQQLYGYGNPKDTFLAISTSGNSENVLEAAIVAKAKDIKVIGLTGKDGGKLVKYADECIIVPENDTYKIQELHLPIYHALCMMLEEEFF